MLSIASLVAKIEAFVKAANTTQQWAIEVQIAPDQPWKRAIYNHEEYRANSREEAETEARFSLDEGAKWRVVPVVVHVKYSVWWLNPDTSKWEVYQAGLSKTKAEKLAHDLKSGFGARWFDHNPSTQVLPDGEMIRTAKLNYQKVYGPYKRRNDENDLREIVIVVMPDGSKRTKSYPKHLVEERLGRELDINETIDHIDYDVLNNAPENLRVVPRNEHSKMDTRRVKLVEFECPECHVKFERSPRLVRDKAKKGRSGPFCSKPCAARYTRKVQLGLVHRAPTQKHHPSEYYRNTKLQEHAALMATKYGFTKTAKEMEPRDEEIALSEVDEERDTVPIELWRKHKHREMSGVQWRPPETKPKQG